MKKTLAMVLALVMMFTLLTGCGGGGGDSGGDGTGAEYTWRMALNGSAPGELGYDMATFFKEKVEELTSGRVSIEFYGGNSLGSTTEVLEREDAAKEELTAEGVTFVDVDNAAFTEHFSGYAEANFPDLADWCNQIRALAPNA